MGSHETPPRLTLDISTTPLRSSSFFNVSPLPDLVPPPLPKPVPSPASRNNLFDQDWSPVTPNLRSRSSTAESQFSTSTDGAPSPASSSGRRSWMDAKEDSVRIVRNTAESWEKTPIPGQHSPEFDWPITPPSPDPFLSKRKSHFRPRTPPPSIPVVTFPPSPASPSRSTFSPRPPLSPSSSSMSSALPPTAGHSENPLLDTRQAPPLRLSPTSNYLLGEGRHASVYLASFSPCSPSPPSPRSPSRADWQLCAAKRLFPDRESQLSGLGEAFIIAKLTNVNNPASPPLASTSARPFLNSPPTLDRKRSSDSLTGRGGRHILKLHGVKDERDGLELPLPLLARSDSKRSIKRYSGGIGGAGSTGGGGGLSTLVGSPLRSTASQSESPSSPESPPLPLANKVPLPIQFKPLPPASASTSTSPTRPHYITRKSLLPSLAPPLSSSSSQRYNKSHASSTQSEQAPVAPQTLAPSPILSPAPVPRSLAHPPVEPRISLILEFCPFGNLLQFARLHPERMNRKRWFQWSRELTSAVALCHERGILHADIKPQNIMIAPDLTTRLCDFGMSLFLPPRKSPRTAFPTDPHGLGTPTYSPPEFVKPLPSTFSYASDVFSLGVTLGVMMAGREPFEGVRAVERMVLVGRGSWWEWEERRRLRDLEEEGEEEGNAAASLYNLSFGGGGDERLSRQGSLRSLRSEKGSLRRSLRRTPTESIRRSGSSESLRSLASLGPGRDWEAVARSLLVEEDRGEEDEHGKSSTWHLADFALPPLPPSTSSSPTHSRSTSLSSTDDVFAFSRPSSYPGTSTPTQTFLDGVSVVPLEVRNLIQRMTSPLEEDRPTAKEVLSQLDELAEKFGQ